MANSKQLLSELTAACQRKTVPSAGEIIELGPTTWFSGVAAPAEAGTVALGMGDVQIIIREKDVRAVDKDGDRFKVKVSTEANVLLHIEKVVRAGGESQGTCCGGHGQTQTDGYTAARELDPPTAGTLRPTKPPMRCYKVQTGSTTTEICIAEDFDG